MKTLPKMQIGIFQEAAQLAFHKAGKGELSTHIAWVFTPVIGNEGINTEAKKAIGVAVRRRYGHSADWYGKHWIIPKPQEKYDMHPFPQITLANVSTIHPYSPFLLGWWRNNANA